jgi:hypothetical protein
LRLGIGVDLHLTRFEMVRELVHESRAHAAREDDLSYRWADQRLDEHKRMTLRARLLAGLQRSVTAR